MKQLDKEFLRDWLKRVQDNVVIRYHKPTGKDMLWNCDEWNKLVKELEAKYNE